MFLRRFIANLFLCLIFTAHADKDLSSLFVIPTENNASNELPFSSVCNESQSKVTCSVKLKDGAYVYKDSIDAYVNKSHFEYSVSVPAIAHEDLNGNSFIFDKDFDVEIYLSDIKKDDVLVFTYRGCDAQGICYPVQTTHLTVSKDIKKTAENAPNRAPDENTLFKSTDSFLYILLLCFVFGAALDLTPCVFPMLSIYSATILGGKYVSISHSLKQNLFYLLGLSLTYCLVGLIFAQLGIVAHGFLQHPLAVIIMSALLVAFALDCMGLIHLKVPNSINNRLQTTIGKQENGTLKKAFVFGALSALLTTPCTSAPLAGALIYVMNTNSLLKGMLLFFFIGLGMGIPLLVIGTYGSKFLNIFRGKSNIVRQILAVPLIIGALYISAHLFGDAILQVKAVVYALCLCYLIYILCPKMPKLTFVCTAFIVFVLFSSGYCYFMNSAKTPFTIIRTYDDLNKMHGRETVVTISASWCSNCHELDETVYSSNEFIEKTKKMNLVRFDFSDTNSKENLEIASKLKVIGVPFIAIIDKDGQVITTKTGTLTLDDVFGLIEKGR